MNRLVSAGLDQVPEIVNGHNRSRMDRRDHMGGNEEEFRRVALHLHRKIAQCPESRTRNWDWRAGQSQPRRLLGGIQIDPNVIRRIQICQGGKQLYGIALGSG